MSLKSFKVGLNKFLLDFYFVWLNLADLYQDLIKTLLNLFNVFVLTKKLLKNLEFSDKYYKFLNNSDSNWS